MSLNNLKTRMGYYGENSPDRMRKDKARGIFSAILDSGHSYVLESLSGETYLGLINSQNMKADYDTKTLAIPYKTYDSYGANRKLVDMPFKVGDVFTWKETDSKWIIFLQYIEETAWFKADIRRCDQSILVNENEYWVYVRGPVETSLQVNQRSSIAWNDLNYSAEMYITKTEETLKYFHRFQTVKIKDDLEKDQTWQVVATDPFYGDGIIKVFLAEYYNNDIKEEAEKEEKAKKELKEDFAPASLIVGPKEVEGYSQATYHMYDLEGGKWYVTMNKLRNCLGEGRDLTLDINSNNGDFLIEYITSDKTESLLVKIKSL